MSLPDEEEFKPIYEHTFPLLKENVYEIISERTNDYNCIAWAAGETENRWWPNNPDFHWPDHAPNEETLDAFITCFQNLGYKICDTDKLESGFEKVALYIDENSKPTHASRQLPSGKWSSKLGPQHDIQHTYNGLDSVKYGTPVKILKRPTSD